MASLSSGAVVRFERPTAAPLAISAPTSTAGKVVVVRGPQGPQGEPGDSGTAALETHIAATEPHPAYDDIADLTLIFNNGLV